MNTFDESMKFILDCVEESERMDAHSNLGANQLIDSINEEFNKIFMVDRDDT